MYPMYCDQDPVVDGLMSVVQFSNWIPDAMGPLFGRTSAFDTELTLNPVVQFLQTTHLSRYGWDFSNEKLETLIPVLNPSTVLDWNSVTSDLLSTTNPVPC